MAEERDLSEMELFEKISMREQVKKEISDQHGPIRKALEGVKYKLAIFSGKGGVGKTSAVINIASALKKMGFSVGIFDTDVHGPSVPKMMGLGKQTETQSTGAQNKTHGASDNSGQMQVHCKRAEMQNRIIPMSDKKPDQMIEDKDNTNYIYSVPNNNSHSHGAWGMSPVETANGIKVMSVSLFWPGEATPILWKGHYKARVIRQLLASVKWGELDFLLVDLPPGTGDEPTTIMKSIPGLDGMVMVTSPQEISVSVCSKAISSAKELGAPLLGLIENMTNFSCPHCGEKIAILGQGRGEDLAKTYKIPFLGRIPLNELAGKAADEGVPVVERYPDSPVTRAYWNITHKLLDVIKQAE
jgi:Mrp family chromosome partitioning ATPase